MTTLARSLRTVFLLLVLAVSASLQAAEPVRLYSVSIAWQSGPTLTAHPTITDRWTFAGVFRCKHLKDELDAHAADELAWNIRTQLRGVSTKLAEFGANGFDPLADAENSSAISDLESYGVMINYRAPTLTMDFPVKLGKEQKTVRVTVERLADAIKVE